MIYAGIAALAAFLLFLYAILAAAHDSDEVRDRLRR